MAQRKMQSALIASTHGQRKSDRQATPVSQNQIRQRELHMKFRHLFSSTLVSRLAKSKQTFYNTENTLNFCSYG